MNGRLATNDAAAAPTTRRRFMQSLAVGVGASLLLGESAAAKSVSPPRPAPTPARLPTALVFDEMNRCHASDTSRLECPARYDALLKALKKSKGFPLLKSYQARPATDDELLACHTAKYLACVLRETASGAKRLSTGDTWICRKSELAAEYAAGAACVAVDAVVGGRAENAFCLTRPPGHHATADRGMGFCVFNNAAVAARYAQRKHRIGKVLIIDWDVHHGNGTQNIFYEDGSVFYFSTHQASWYPWTGAKTETGRGKGLGTTLNCPFARGAGRKEIMGAYHDKLAPALSRFKPELVIISAGFDSRHGDPLGRFELTDEDFRDLTALVLEMAEPNAKGRVVSLLEGGYHLTGLASAAVAHVERLQQG